MTAVTPPRHAGPQALAATELLGPLSLADPLAPPSTWAPPAAGGYFRWPLPHMGLGDRLLFRTIAFLGRRQIGSITGLENLRPEHDPFILAANHTSRREAILLPTMFFLHRGGRVIRFMADWNPLLIPVIRLIYRRGRVILVTAKSARPAFLNLLKPFLVRNAPPPFDDALATLDAGGSIGIFPEGTVNADSRALLRGQLGTAKLAVRSGRAVIPVGIRSDDAEGSRGRPAPLHIRIGEPMHPPPAGSGSATRRIGEFHGAMMREIGRLSNKSWDGGSGIALPVTEPAGGHA